MSSGAAFGICVLVIMAVGIILIRWQAGKSTRRLSVAGETPVVVWKGGLQTKTMRASLGTAKLELFEWGLRIRGRGLWRVMLPTWEARYRELTKAQMIRWPIANPGVLISTDGSAVPIVFVTWRGREVLDALEARGVPVDRSVARLRQYELRRELVLAVPSEPSDP